MPKFYVRIFGSIPAELEVDAKNRNEAEEKALLEVCDRLSFSATLVEEPVAKEAK